MRQRLVLAVMVLAGCETRSSVPDGEHEGLRYLLPDDYVEVFEDGDDLTLYALGAAQATETNGCGERAGRSVVGRAVLREPSRIRWHAHFVYRAILGGTSCAACFDPDLSLVFRRADRSIELLVSESCRQAQVRVARGDAPPRPRLAIARLDDRYLPTLAAALRRRCVGPATPGDADEAIELDEQVEAACCERGQWTGWPAVDRDGEAPR